LASDVVAGAAKQKAADLAMVYESSAVLVQLRDPAIAPKTIGDLYQKTFAASVAKSIPRRPYLSAVRDIIDIYIGAQPPEATLTDASRADFQAKFTAIAAALKEASK